jgi:hypothetical protein
MHISLKIILVTGVIPEDLGQHLGEQMKTLGIYSVLQFIQKFAVIYSSHILVEDCRL